MHSLIDLPQNPNVHILFLTFNRLYYTQKTLPALLESADTASCQIRIVDNGSTDGTIEYLQKLSHPKIERVIYNKKNEGLVKPTKNFWKESKAEFIGKIDNDILVPRKWIEKLVDAHQKIPELGVVGYCHFRKEDFNNNKVKKKVENINGVYIRRQPWIGGHYIIKSHHLKKYSGYTQSRKLLKKRKFYGFTKYQKKLSEQGLIHGYICDKNKNLLFWEHIDDPRNKYYCTNSKYINRLENENIIKWYKQDARNLLEES